ncbi:MAG TPA: hypothetical protein DIC60_04030 [Lachnospiraceae bacterium]|nr:hypothetical protein [Lachnospiraceae bacterium]
MEFRGDMGLMKKLYIIGNGFDVAHGIHTDYWKFRTYLEQNYPEFLGKFEKLYGIQQLDDTEPWYTIEAQERWNTATNKDLWSEFEESMGHPDTTDMLNFSSCILDDMDLEGGNIGIQDTMDVYWREQFGFINLLQDYVKEWIEQIDTSGIFPRKKELIGNNGDYFLNFNYTDVLEQVYQIEEVTHIHGSIESLSDISPIMGHCNKAESDKHRQWAKEADEEYDEGESSIQNAIADYLEAIFKDTNSIIDDNSRFFGDLHNIEHVIIIGWSAGNVDIPYLLKIKECVNRNTKWAVHWYNDEAYASLRRALDEVKINENYEVEYVQTEEFWDNVP